jgi:hypothetical protein
MRFAGLGSLRWVASEEKECAGQRERERGEVWPCGGVRNPSGIYNKGERGELERARGNGPRPAPFSSAGQPPARCGLSWTAFFLTRIYIPLCIC